VPVVAHLYAGDQRHFVSRFQELDVARERAAGEGAAGTDFSSSPLFDTVYDVDGVTIWRLAGS